MIDKLIQLVRKGFSNIQDHRSSNVRYLLVDILISGFAMFSLKDFYLLIFRKQYARRSKNLERVYGIKKLPEDTALREGLDSVKPSYLDAQFSIPIEELRSQGVLDDRLVLGGYTAISCDATRHYCSRKKQCPHCMVKIYAMVNNVFIISY